MGLSVSNIIKWYKMLCGKSILHVNQIKGIEFRKDELRGYYNDMTQKVTIMPEILETDEMPLLKLDKGQNVYFPVAIFQYGLGAYDLFLKTNDDKYLRKFKQCADWAVKHQDEKGRWNNFYYVYPEHPYGAMAQGEAASLLCRAYKQFNEIEFLEAAEKGIRYMLKPLSEEGTTEYTGEDVVLREYTHLATVMNGWIFAWWGLYDYVLCTGDKNYKTVMKKSCDSLVKYLPKFNNRYWSMYDLDGKIASPFYHHLHIAQMQAMYELTDIEEFKFYADLWQRRENSSVCYWRAFLRKAAQKIIE